MTAKQAGFWRRHRVLKWALLVLLLGVGALGIAISVALEKAEPLLRAALIAGLEQRFHTHVELDSFHISLADGFWAEGKGLRIWPPRQSPSATPLGAPLTAASAPLVRLAEFRFHAPLRLKFGRPIRISVVELTGLIVDVPPRTRLAHSAPAPAPAPGAEPRAKPLLQFQVESIRCRNAHLTLQTDKPGKIPLEFAIDRIDLASPDGNGSMRFSARLTNPRPAGVILAEGSIGPWVVDDPGQTPLNGAYRFEHADLSVFKGIAGILQSTGNYAGVLRDLTVDGETVTPDFRLTSFGTAVPLRTAFHAQVDGTNGDTFLQPVRATLGQSHLIAEGKIVRVLPQTAANGFVTPGGHQIALNVTVDNGRIEDFLRLTSRSGTPLLTGALHLKTTLDLPPGTAKVEARLQLKGTFTLDDAQFTNPRIQNQVRQLSLRALGRPQDARQEAAADVRSAMQSDFTMAGAIITLPNLEYTVPGAEIDLKGIYGVQDGGLDFTGAAKMQATVSQIVGGWMGKLLKPADRLFSKDGAGTEIPVHVSGTRKDPSFGVDLGKLGHSVPVLPGEPQ